MDYRATTADLLPIPESFQRENRYLGYRAEDRKKPYAHFFQERVARMQDHVFDALAIGQQPSEYAYDIEDAAERLSKPGYERLETGYAAQGNGRFMVAIHTHMPRVSAEMWDWWYAWHGHEAARYKLWHPEAHMCAPFAEDRRGKGLLLSDQYIDNVSFAAEYLDGTLGNLALRFVDPTSLGFTREPGALVVSGRLGIADAPIMVGWGLHQIRPLEGGCEMRSRFFFGDVGVIGVPAHGIFSAGGRVLRRPWGKLASPLIKRVVRPDIAQYGAPLVVHCAQEMNHLARFLPELYAEFRYLP